MHCDLEQELGQVLGGEVDNWPTHEGSNHQQKRTIII